MSYEDYTWLRYYEDLYHRQKKKNNELAMKLGETTAKTEELNVTLNRVVGSSFWRALAPARKIYGKITGNSKAGSPEATKVNAGSPEATKVNAGSSEVENTSTCSDADRIYHARLEQYEDFYGQWIRKNAIEKHYADYQSDTGRNRIRESHFSKVNIEDLSGEQSLDKLLGSGQWLLFVGKNGMLANAYAERIGLAVEAHPDAKICYADEDYIYDDSHNAARRIMPNFKPDWSPDTLDSFFYFGHIALLHADFVKKLTWLGDENPWANVYDLFLQASELVGKHFDDPAVLHIPQVLFHNIVETPEGIDDDYLLWKKVTEQLEEKLGAGKLCIGASSEYKNVRQRAIERRVQEKLSPSGTLIPGQDPESYHILYDVPEDTTVSVLLLSKDHPDTLETCLSSFIERTDVRGLKLEFIIIDNGSDEENKSKYEDMTANVLGDMGYEYKYLHLPQEFNFSRLCNIAAENAKGEMLLFMNDDIEIVQKDWLRLMVGYASLAHVGAVGAKLLYAGTDLIQHIGVTSLAIGPSHKMVAYPDDKSYYFGRNMLAYDSLGVTAACLIVAKDRFNQIGGFDEGYAVAYNDVDLCFKLAKLGFVNLQCNGSLLMHYESLSRGADEGNEEKWGRLLIEKDRLYGTHPEYYQSDPYYSPNLIGNHSNYLSDYDFGYNIHVKNEIVRQIDASKLAKNTSEKYKISIDFAGIQSKHNLEEPVITEVRGWCFEPGADNSTLGVSVLLQNQADGTLLEAKSDPMPREDLLGVFRDEINNGLCGFVCKMLNSDIPEGKYRVGVEIVRLNHDLATGEDTISGTGEMIMTDTYITI